MLARRWQAAFRRDGYVAGDRIAVCVRNGINWVAIDIAALGMGLVVVPLYVDDTPDNVAWCVGNADARLLVVENSRISAGLAKCADPARPMPPVIVLRPDQGDTARRPRLTCRRRHRSSAVERVGRRCTGDDLFHVRDSGPPERCHVVARKHHRQCRAMCTNGHGAGGRPVPFDTAVVAHVRAYRWLLSSDVAGREGGVCAWRRTDRRRSRVAAANGDVRRAPHIRTLSRAHRGDAGEIAGEEATLRHLRGTRLSRRDGQSGFARSPTRAGIAQTGRRARCLRALAADCASRSSVVRRSNHRWRARSSDWDFRSCRATA